MCRAAKAGEEFPVGGEIVLSEVVIDGVGVHMKVVNGVDGPDFIRNPTQEISVEIHYEAAVCRGHENGTAIGGVLRHRMLLVPFLTGCARKRSVRDFTYSRLVYKDPAPQRRVVLPSRHRPSDKIGERCLLGIVIREFPSADIGLFRLREEGEPDSYVVLLGAVHGPVKELGVIGLEQPYTAGGHSALLKGAEPSVRLLHTLPRFYENLGPDNGKECLKKANCQ